MPAVVRIGDAGSHGGVVVSGSEDTPTNGRRTARVGDIYNCAEHGPNPIVTGSPDVFVNGRAVARVGDQTACGATLVSGSPDTFAN
jgi:uncharacterized Zn-binding protein involved in type VI secretion